MAKRDEEVLEVTVEDILYRSDDGRFMVVRTSRPGSDSGPLLAHQNEVVVVGDLGDTHPGETLRVRGRWSTHRDYGRRFRADGFVPVIPTTAQGVARYLGSGLVAGVGPALAERVVERFGAQTLDVITREASRLREVDGIGAKRAEALAEAVRSRREEAESLSFLHGVGLGPALARKILRRYGSASARLVREDPYLVAEQIRGIGFRTADRVGAAAGIKPDDPRRAAGAVLHLLGKGADEGHVYLELDELVSGAEQLSIPSERIPSAVDQLRARELVVVEDTAVYAPPLHTAETAVAERLARLAGGPRRPTGSAIARALAATDMKMLTDEQRAVVRASFANGLIVVTGGPGTGKTTTVRGIVEAHERAGRSVLLCAPTGRAAKRLTEATGREARTIHRTLEWNPGTGRFGRDASFPLPADLILVDEASMLDLRLADNLFSAVPPRSTLALVGDVDQLPPVGPGQTLREVIASGVAQVVRLTHVFRQAERSAIVRGAHKILRGQVPTPTPTGTRARGDLFVIRARDPETLDSRLIATLRRVSAAYGLDPKLDVQVLSPMRRGPAGTQRLNELLQHELNPPDTDSPSPRDLALRPGDKVMQLRNDYNKEVFNGDLGTVHRVEGGITFVEMDGRLVQYEPDDLDELTLAYASTIHKVQGSEFPAVVIVLHASHYVLLSRALLYTAVTRGRQLVVLVGDERALRRAAQNAVTYRSNSKLEQRLRDLQDSYAATTPS